MTDYVSANPERLSRLAQLLGNSAGVIKSNEPGIRSAIKSWNQSVDTSALTKLAAWLAEQQRPVSDQAAAAYTALQQPIFRSHLSSPEQALKQPRVTIAFTGTPESLARQGGQDAANWAKRIASKDKPDQLATDMAYSLETHADDPAYLEAFFANGGAKVLAQMPRHELSVNKKLPLLGGSQWRLATYGKAIAIATTLQDRGVIKLPPDAWKPITHPENGDLWSSGALVHYVPKDHTFGPTFLHELATSALAWRKAHEPARPTYFKAPPGVRFSSSGHVEPDNPWWKDLNLDVDLDSTGRDDTADMAQIREQDPVLAILTKTGANPEASRRLLTGDNGDGHARQLVDVHWQCPSPAGPIDESAGPAAIIVAATSDRGPANGEASAQAALNLINAANDEHHEKRDDLDREQYPRISPTQAAALSFVASRYAGDLTTAVASPGDANGVGKDGSGLFVLNTNRADLDGFLSLFMTQPHARGAFEGALRAQLTAASFRYATRIGQLTGVGELAGLLGAMTQIENAMELDEASERDAAAARGKAYFGVVVDLVDALPIPGDAMSFAQGVGVAMGGVFGDLIFGENATEKAVSDGRRRSFTAANSMKDEIAQGLLQAKKIQLPPDPSFVHDGLIRPQNAEERAAFDRWWKDLGETPKDIEAKAYANFQRGKEAP